MKRVLTIFLAIALMATALTGCGKNEKSTDGTASANPDFLYIPEYIQLPDDVKEVRVPALIGNTVYFTAIAQTGSQNPDGTAITAEQLFKINADGTGYTKIEGFSHPEVPETAPQGSAWYISRILPAEGTNAWVSAGGTFGYFDSASFQYVDDTRSSLRKIDLSTGNVIAEIEIQKPEASSSSPFMFGAGTASMMTVDKDGNIYLAGQDGTITIYGPNGNNLGSISIPTGNMISDLVGIPDGRAGAIYRDMSGNIMLSPIDPAQKKLDAGYALPLIQGKQIKIAGEVSGITFYDTNSLYAYELESGARTEIINWIDCDVDGTNLTVIGSPDENTVLCCSAIYNSSGFNDLMSMLGGSMYFPGMDMLGSSPDDSEFILLRKTPASEVVQKITLTLAVNGLDNFMRKAVLDFNKRDPEYRIKVVDYSVYNTADDYTAGITKLNTEIISGSIPDIMQTRDLPFRIYTSKGLLEDLYPYLDKDTELGGRDALLQAFLNALETDGKLFRIGSGFWITSLVGNMDIVGQEIGWNMDELNAVMAGLPEDTRILPYYATRDVVMDFIFTYNLDEYVDYVSGTSSFDNPEFIKILELVKSFPDTFDWNGIMGQALDEPSEIMSGKQLLQVGTFNGFDQLLSTDALFGGKSAFKGFPCESKNGFAFEPMLCVAMSSHSKYKEGAWRFIRTMLTAEFQERNTMVFPSNQICFDAAVKAAMTENTEPSLNVMGMDFSSLLGGADIGGSKDTDGDGVKDVYPKGLVASMGTDMMFYYAMTQEQYDRFMDFINHITRVTERDETLVSIVNEEAGAFFADQKSAEETAKLIQTRVQLYLNEQK